MIRPSALFSWLACLLVMSAATLAAPGANGPEELPPTYVLFTVDVESGTDSQRAYPFDVWGELHAGPEGHGIGKMMDILDRHGVKGTFFVNVYEWPRTGRDVLSAVCRRIRDRGHDPELHTHPAPLFGVSVMQEADVGKQAEILRSGAGFIREWTGLEVVAHRAGAFKGNLDTVRACAEARIPLEFTPNMASPQCELGGALTQNAPVVYEGVLCVPVTAYVQAAAGSWRSLRFLDIEASSTEEIKSVVFELHSHGVRTAVIMLHSFSFTRDGTPNLRAERVLDDLVSDFAGNRNYRVVSARELYAVWRACPAALVGADHLPTTGWWMLYCRAWQRLGEGWRNVLVALGPPAVVMGGFLAVAVLRFRRGRRTSAA